MTEEDLQAEQESYRDSEVARKEAEAQGYCYYCGENLKDCTGYKCWIRQEVL